MIYIFVGAITAIIQYFSLHIQETKLSVPYVYVGDSLIGYVQVKSIIENGWFLSNRFLGVPFPSGNFDFVQFDTLHLLILKFISIIFHNPIKTVNIYYLLLFPLTTIISLFVLRHFRLSWIVAIFVSILFSFLSFRILRSTIHLFLNAYYLLPLTLIVFDWQLNENKNIFSSRKKRQLLISLLVSLGMGLSGLYYAYFYCFFLSLIAIKNLLQKNIHKLLTTLAIIAFTCLVLIMNILPNIHYFVKYGVNTQVGIRHPLESEVYALKITKLFIPPNPKRNEFVNNLRTRYFAQTQLNTGTEYLGLFGAIGFLVLLITLTRVFFASKIHQTLLNNLSYLNVFAVLLSTMAGFGSIVAFTISPQIRAYDRMSVYIAYFSLVALGVVLDNLYMKYCKTNLYKFLFALLLSIGIFYGINDQTKNLLPPYQIAISEYSNDEKFVKNIEKIIPSGSHIFQLPYVPYPESVVQNISYDHFKPYLHSTNLYWSYGSSKGRIGDQWQTYVTSLPIESFISTIYLAGFSGLYIDRNGYADQGKLIESQISIFIGNPIVISDNKRYVFYSLNSEKDKYTSYSKADLLKLKNGALKAK